MGKQIAGLTAVMVLGGTGWPLAGADASTLAAPESSREEHCVVEVVEVLRSGELLTSEPECFGTLADALATFRAVEVVIATHYDGANRTGSSLTVTGLECAGGYLNLGSTWVNRISSTSNGCASVRFFDGFDKSGAAELTGSSTVNLGSLNNAANSVQYGS